VKLQGGEGEEVRGKVLQVFVDLTITLGSLFLNCILILYEISSVVKTLNWNSD